MNPSRNIISFRTSMEINKKEFDRKMSILQDIRNHQNLSKLILEKLKELAHRDSEEVWSLIHGFEQINQNLAQNRKTYQQLVDEKCFVDAYAAFEKLLYDHFYAIFKYFPHFLKSKEKNAEGDLIIKYEDLFEDANITIETMQIRLIEKRVKGYIQSENIQSVLKKFDSFLNGTSNKIDTDTQHDLIRFSKIRNILMHNEGIINIIFIDDLKRFGIEIESYGYEIGNSIGDTIFPQIEASMNVYRKVADAITNHFILQAENIKKNKRA